MEVIMKKTQKNILAAVICMFCLTGCIRMSEEMRLLSGKSGYAKPPNHFYMGSKGCSGFIFSAWPYIWPFVPFFLLDFPFELVADTLCIPHDIYLYHDYKQNPPLALLVKEKRYDELEKRLKGGEIPNKFDWRMPDGMSPLQQALQDQNVKAYSLLLEHGATPDETSFTNFLNLLTNDNKEIIRLALERCPAKYDVIYVWCRNHLKSTRKLNVSEQLMLIDIIEMMAGHGFPVQSPASVRIQRETALDMVFDDKTMLSPENRQRLIDILKAHGGKTYMELTQIDKSLPHLHTENLQIDPIFRQIVEKLEKSWQSDQYRLSTHYDGIDGPVLVIDLPMPLLDAPRKPLETRMTISAHRRISATKWNQEGEPFDVPTGWRMIATPKGRKMPSRLLPDMPRFLLDEKWLTLPDCEVYLESGGKFFPNNSSSIQRILKLDKPSSAQKPPEIHEASFEAYFLHRDMRTWTFRLTKADEKWLSSLNKATASAGLPGQWNRCSFEHDRAAPFYAYDVHGRFSHKTDEHPEIIPSPDEIICLITKSTFKSAKANKTMMNSREGNSYWNYWKISNFGYDIHIFFGDEVTMDQLNQMQTAVENVIEKQ